MTGERGNCKRCGTELTSENQSIYDSGICQRCENIEWRENHEKMKNLPNDEA